MRRQRCPECKSLRLLNGKKGTHLLRGQALFGGMAELLAFNDTSVWHCDNREVYVARSRDYAERAMAGEDV